MAKPYTPDPPSGEERLIAVLKRIAKPAAAGHVDRLALFAVLVTRFSREELEQLCFALDVDYEQLRNGGPKGTFVRDVIVSMERAERFDDLLTAAKELRPDAFTEPNHQRPRPGVQ